MTSLITLNNKIKSFRAWVNDGSYSHLPTFDYTKLTAINVCPTWGLIRYERHKQMPGHGRAMALEAGAAAHEVFAGVRLIDLRRQQKFVAHADYHGERLFGAERWQSVLIWLNKADDIRTRELNGALELLYSSGFYDDPSDKRRTTANIEEALIAYYDRWPFGQNQVWVADDNDPEQPIGVEVPIDLVVEFTDGDGEVWSYRYTGKIDGLHWHRDRLAIHENKTASRLDEAWRQSFLLSHQVTGYALAAAFITGQVVSDAYIHGCAIPQPRSGYDFGGIVRENVSRDTFMMEQWVEWFWHGTRIYEAFKDDPTEAPKYTHSCNRYFRPCSFIPLCATPPEERRDILENEMEHDEWNPLVDIGGKAGD